jgi:hypothetical protein
VRTFRPTHRQIGRALAPSGVGFFDPARYSVAGDAKADDVTGLGNRGGEPQLVRSKRKGGQLSRESGPPAIDFVVHV